MSIMGNVAGLGAVQPDWAQTDEKMADFIRNKPDIGGIERDVEAFGALAEAALPKAGGAMAGDIAMGGSRVTGLGAPVAEGDAATKAYVDGAAAKPLYREVLLPAASWTGSGPYMQQVYSEGIREEDRPHWGILYSGDLAQRQEQKEAFALVDELEAEEDWLVFTCFGEKPGADIRVQVEVTR